MKKAIGVVSMILFSAVVAVSAHRASSMALSWNVALFDLGLVKGSTPDGSHHPWMDDMRRQGVKRAWIVVFNRLGSQPKPLEVIDAAYYSAQNREGTQITDPSWLERIRSSGLSAELELVALDRAVHSPWFDRESILIPVDLADDEAIPTSNYEEAQAHLQQVANSLPPESALRRNIEAGDHGDGTYFRWMDMMRESGIKRAEVSIHIEFDQNGRPRKTRVLRTVYYTEYESLDSQLQDPNSLRKIRSSGLEESLEKIALQRAENGAWLETPRPRPKPYLGSTVVNFFDDGWLPHLGRPLFAATQLK
jgi:hypothetical protein